MTDNCAASVHHAADLWWVEQVWRVLTDYERLAEFVPNLERCERLPRGPNGRVRLRQVRLNRDCGHC